MTKALCFSSINKRLVFNGKGGKDSHWVSSSCSWGSDRDLEWLTCSISVNLSHSFLCLPSPLTIICCIAAVFLIHTPTHAALITHKPIREHFHWHNMKWPSDWSHRAHTWISPHIHLLLCEAPCLLFVDRWKRRRDTERQMIALKRENNSISSSSRPRQFNQYLWIAATKDRGYNDFDVWCETDWIPSWLITSLAG